ncbi:MAG: hypothetical protein HY904_08685 [Deltaproteobacteria bacterium]|nr:hypothetical protein [Deltaproteobacteria bacterium]
MVPAGRVHVLDANGISLFRAAGLLANLGHAAVTVRMAVVEEVHAELTRKGAPDAAALRVWQGWQHIKVEPLPARGSMADTLKALRSTRQPGNLRDMGEHASIAWAVHTRGAVFVTHDQKATVTAVREKVEVMTSHGFVQCLQETGLLMPDECRRLSTTERGFRDCAPTWWAGWLAGI